VALAGLGGLALVLVAVLAPWDDGLVAGPALLFAAYALSVGESGSGVDWVAPLVAVVLLAVVELGSWSLELRDGAEERPIARVPRVLLLCAAAAATGTFVLALGGIRTDAGLVLWVSGAAAAIGLLALITQAARS
jgi:hypothetical protein